MDRFARITRAWAGQTVACIGSGPSATLDALTALREAKLKTIAVNDMYLVAPWADVSYFADTRWWDWHHHGRFGKKFSWVEFAPAEVSERFRAFAGAKITIENSGALIPDADVFMLHNLGYEGLSEVPNGLHTGSNSGYQAINIAYLAGARRIVLVGYDLRFEKGRSHSHNGHPVDVGEERYHQYARNYSSMVPQLAKAGVEVINCSPKSKVTAFPIKTIEEALCA